MKKLIAMLLVLTMVLSFAACAKKDAGMSHADYVAADNETEVVVETYVQAHQSWWDNKVTVYCQSPDGAYFLYELACSEEDAAKLVPGTKIRVTGYKGEWSGEVEIMDGTFEFVKGDSYIAEPLDVTDLLGTDTLIDHQNEFVSFTGLTVAPSTDANGNEAAFLYNWDGSGEKGNDLYFNVTVNGQTYTFCVESYLCGQDTEVYQAVEALQIGDVINAEGFSCTGTRASTPTSPQFLPRTEFLTERGKANAFPRIFFGKGTFSRFCPAAQPDGMWDYAAALCPFPQKSAVDQQNGHDPGAGERMVQHG